VRIGSYVVPGERIELPTNGLQNPGRSIGFYNRILRHVVIAANYFSVAEDNRKMPSSDQVAGLTARPR
jgi:hypothetical protein